MSRIEQLTKQAAEMNDEERLALQRTAGYEKGIYQMQTQDIIRLVVYRRAVRAGYYSEGPDETYAMKWGDFTLGGWV